jgi:hypothetical protein
LENIKQKLRQTGDKADAIAANTLNDAELLEYYQQF